MPRKQGSPARRAAPAEPSSPDPAASPARARVPIPAVYPARARGYEPWETLAELFADVQMAGIFPDSKTFADARPRFAPRTIRERYDRVRFEPGFQLRAFVAEHFDI